MTIETTHTPYYRGQHGYIYFGDAVVIPVDFGESKADLWLRLLNAAYQRGRDSVVQEEAARD